MGRTIILQIVNIFFNLLPLTSCYKLKAILLKLAGIECDSSARIVSTAKFICINTSIGKDTFIGHQVLITGSNKYAILIGDNVDLAPRVCILSGGHRIDMLGKHSAGEGSGGNVIIEDGVWIGANSTILPGVKIGTKAVIGAGSVVTKDIPPYSIAVGNPCKVIKKWNLDNKFFERVINI
jgi:maltose O-acetyltransferase